MCGIAGIFDVEGQREIDRHAVERMTDALTHRGPDSHGYHFEPGLGLGHRRLAIVDIDGGHQPFTSSTGKTVITYNGEIYNHRDLAPEIEAAGRSLRTRSDTEVLAELIDLRGADALPALQGMFAFAAWSPRDETFLLARDRMGEKPLYYYLTKDGFLLFASEIDALLASGMAPDVIDPTAVADYLFYGYVPDPKSIYRDIRKLPPACCLTIKRGRKTAPVRRWWRVNFTPDPRLGFAEAERQVMPLVDAAVTAQMMADRPVAAFLSGGVDSSAILSAMVSKAPEPVTTCAIGFDDPTYDERRSARRVSTLFLSDHREHEVTLDAAGLLPTLAKVYGEPFADSSALPTYLLCRLTRRYAPVALSGDGGDEVFAGYDRYAGVLRESRLRRVLPGPARSGVVGPAGRLYPELPGAPQPLRLRSALQAIGEDQEAGYARAVSAVLPERCEALLSEPMRDYRPQAIVESAIAAADTDDPVLQAQAADLATWLPGRILVKVDRASMAHGLEVRPPLLDHRLVEWAATLPRHYKLKGGTSKRVLKQALEARLPDDVLYRPKQGFGAPVDTWFSDPGGRLLSRLREGVTWRDSGYFDVDQVLKTADRHEQGRGHHGQELWSVLMFDAFLNRDRPPDRETGTD